MPRYHATATYLHQRNGIWYFRFRLPNEIRSDVNRREIHLSLQTRHRPTAVARASVGLTYIYALKRVAYDVNRLTEQARQKIVRELLERMESSLRASRTPWLDAGEPQLLRKRYLMSGYARARFRMASLS
jgi:hypothetical protein